MARRSVGDAGTAVDEFEDFASDPRKWAFEQVTDRKSRTNTALREQMEDIFDERLKAAFLVVVVLAIAYAPRARRRRRR